MFVTNGHCCRRGGRTRVPEGDLAWFIFGAVAQRRVQRMNFWYPMGSNIGLSNRLGDVFIPYCAQSILTCRCKMGDNRIRDVCSLPKKPEITIICRDIGLANGLLFLRQLYRMRRQTLSKKRSRTARPKRIQRSGNSFYSIPVGFLPICSKPSH